METRYRIENDQSQAWDSTDKRWRSIFDGRFNTYKSEAQALAAARRIKHVMFQSYPKTIQEDIQP